MRHGLGNGRATRGYPVTFTTLWPSSPRTESLQKMEANHLWLPTRSNQALAQAADRGVTLALWLFGRQDQGNRAIRKLSTETQHLFPTHDGLALVQQCNNLMQPFLPRVLRVRAR